MGNGYWRGLGLAGVHDLGLGELDMLAMLVLATTVLLNGNWDFRFEEDKMLESVAAADFAATDTMTVPGCYDVMSRSRVVRRRRCKFVISSSGRPPSRNCQPTLSHPALYPYTFPLHLPLRTPHFSPPELSNGTQIASRYAELGETCVATTPSPLPFSWRANFLRIAARVTPQLRFAQPMPIRSKLRVRRMSSVFPPSPHTCSHFASQSSLRSGDTSALHRPLLSGTGS